MSLIDFLHTIYDNFRQSKVRFLLTLSGISIGVALLIIMGSFLESAGVSLMQAQQGIMSENQLRAVPQKVSRKQAHRTTYALNDLDAKATTKSDFFKNATIEYERNIYTQVKKGSIFKQVALVGIGKDTPLLYKLELRHGRFFTDNDLDQHRKVCIIGTEVEKFFHKKKITLLGNFLSINNNNFRVIGVLEKKVFFGKTSSLDLWDRRVLIPVTTFRSVIRANRAIEVLLLSIPITSELKTKISFLKQMLAKLLLRRHYGVKNFSMKNPFENDKVSGLMEIIIKILFYGIASLALLVGGINIMNIMLITVTERTREIGIRRAVGCSQKTLLKQFILEAGLISLFGGIIGIIAGILFTIGQTMLLNSLWNHWELVIDIKTIIAGTFVSFFTGIIFGFYPALKASKLTPDECLRYE